MNKKYILIIFLLLLLTNTAFAFSPAPTHNSMCQRQQRYYTDIFHKSAAEYNTNHTPEVDTNSPFFTYENAVQFLKDNDFIYDLRKSSEKCQYALVYIASGTPDYPNYKNYFYCKFHGSENLKIESSYPKDMEDEYRRDMRNKKISAFIYQSQDLFLFCLIFVLPVIIFIFSNIKTKKKE